MYLPTCTSERCKDSSKFQKYSISFFLQINVKKSLLTTKSKVITMVAISNTYKQYNSEINILCVCVVYCHSLVFMCCTVFVIGHLDFDCAL